MSSAELDVQIKITIRLFSAKLFCCVGDEQVYMDTWGLYRAKYNL